MNFDPQDTNSEIARFYERVDQLRKEAGDLDKDIKAVQNAPEASPSDKRLRADVTESAVKDALTGIQKLQDQYPDIKDALAKIQELQNQYPDIEKNLAERQELQNQYPHIKKNLAWVREHPHIDLNQLGTDLDQLATKFESIQNESTQLRETCRPLPSALAALLAARQMRERSNQSGENLAYPQRRF
jgi:DNA repair exonuclease SbcCD ATPase subunit